MHWGGQLKTGKRLCFPENDDKRLFNITLTRAANI
jgi:hypothetical protein